jgi:hypothetical protein
VRSATPLILNHSETSGNGEIIYIQGSDFGSNPLIEYSYNDANWTTVPTITSGDGTATFRIPGTETRLPDVVTVRVSADSVSWSPAVFVNTPDPSFLSTDQIATGSAFQIFGRNLYFSRTPIVRLVDQADGSSQTATVDVTKSQHYMLNVVAPNAIVPGHAYQIFISNGYSGNASTAVEAMVPETLRGRRAGADYWQLGLPWAADLDFYANVYDITSDPRLDGNFATGNGVTDDTGPIFHAIEAAAAAGGGVVFLPAGSYTLHFSNGCGIQLPSRVVLQGASAASVHINYGYPVGSNGGPGVCFQSLSGMADITMNNVDTVQQWQYSALSANASEVFLKRVTWNIGTSQGLSLAHNDHIAIEDSTITQTTDSKFAYVGPVDLQSCAHCQISGSTIGFTVGGMLFDWARDIVFENNTVLRDISVAPDPSTVTHSIAANFVNNLALLNNTFNSVGSALPTNNDGEVIVTEGGGPMRYDEFRGSITFATPTTLSDTNQNFYQLPNTLPGLQVGIANVAIVSGNGSGQRRLVTDVSADGKTLTIDHPWDVQPDLNSHYATFDWSAANWIVVHNSLRGNFKGLEIFNASVSNLLLESNVLTDSDGIMVSPSEYAKSSTAGGLFNVIDDIAIVGNTLIDQSGIRPAYVGLIPREDLETAAFGTHILGASIKANNVTGFNPNVYNAPVSWDDYKAVTEGYLCDYFWQSSSSYDSTAPAPLLANIFQGNMAWRSKTAFYLNSGAAQTVISDSYLANVGSAEQNVVLLGASSGSQGTNLSESLSLFAVGSTASSAVVLQGTASYYGGPALEFGHQGGPTYSVANSGDTLNLFGMEIVGNLDLLAHVILKPNTAASGTLMMRESTDSTSPFVGLGISSDGIFIQTRGENESSLQTTTIPFSSTKAWLRLRYYSGASVSAMFSVDGRSWTEITVTVTFKNNSYMAGVADLSSGIGSGTLVTYDGLAYSSITTSTSHPAKALR